LAYALREAERAGRIVLHVRVDERSAGFLALGLAKVTRVPAVVVTTSGTAVANLHPAVLEAHHGVVPLVVLSADRPVELRGTGANQTTVQPGIFAGAVRWSVDAAAPQRATGEVARWRQVAADAVRHATGVTGAVDVGEPGPVHVNVQLREPLVPTDDEGPWPESLDERRAEDAADSTTATGSVPTTDVSRQPTRTVVVVGDLPEPDQFDRAVRWATARGWPVLAEPFGTHPRGDVVPHGPLVLSDPRWLDQHAPERVIAVGRLTLSRPVAALLRRPGVRVEAVGAHAWIVSRPDVQDVHPVSVLDAPVDDSDSSNGQRGSGGADSEAGAGGEGATGPSDDCWAAAWRAAGERIASSMAEEQLPWPSGAAVADAVLAALPAGATLFLGSSNTGRDVDLAGPRADALRVVASRGLAGNDGCVSTASGLALADGSPTYALMGDLTFLHDANGLLVGPLERRPDLTVVVTNDDGGGIFTLLEPGEPARVAEFERLFGTPTGADLAALCAAHHVRHQHVSTRDELVAALAERPSGLSVLEGTVDRGGHRVLHARLRERAAAALRT
jgi:2-succinyl-5-enolpyruvyl-6-hydroxy-3-cyclohexene-1-carboxylate synthase